MSEYDNPIWAVIANIVREHRTDAMGKVLRVGTRKFHGGAKVYIAGAYWGMGGASVIVVGHFRGKQLITCAVNAAYLENFRVKLAYNPEVIRRLTEHRYGMEILDGGQESKLKAQDYAEKFAKNSASWTQKRLARWVSQKLALDYEGSEDEKDKE